MVEDIRGGKVRGGERVNSGEIMRPCRLDQIGEPQATASISCSGSWYCDLCLSDLPKFSLCAVAWVDGGGESVTGREQETAAMKEVRARF